MDHQINQKAVLNGYISLYISVGHMSHGSDLPFWPFLIASPAGIILHVLVTPFELGTLIASLVKDTLKVMLHYFISSNILLQKRESKHMLVIAISTGNVIRNYSSLGKRTHLMHSKAKYRI